MTDYESLEREHFGDADKRTGIYADRCSHGVPWLDDCEQCALVSAREAVEHWGALVDASRALIRKAELRAYRESHEHHGETNKSGRHCPLDGEEE